METNMVNDETNNEDRKRKGIKPYLIFILVAAPLIILLAVYFFYYKSSYFQKISDDGYTPTQLMKSCKAANKCPDAKVTIQGDLKNISNDYRRYMVLDNEKTIMLDLPTDTTLLERVQFAEKNKVIFGASHIKTTAIAYYEGSHTPGLGMSYGIKVTVNPEDVVYLGEKQTSDKVLGQQGMGNLIAGYDQSFKLSEAIVLFENSALKGKIRVVDPSSSNSGYEITRPYDSPYDSVKLSWNFFLKGNGAKGEFASDSYYMTVTKNNITIYQNYSGSRSLENGEAQVIESLNL